MLIEHELLHIKCCVSGLSVHPDRRYVRALLSSHYFDFITSKANRGGTQKFVSLGDLRQMRLPLPPSNLQKRFATIVASVEQQKARYQTHLNELAALFASPIPSLPRGALGRMESPRTSLSWLKSFHTLPRKRAMWSSMLTVIHERRISTRVSPLSNLLSGSIRSTIAEPPSLRT